MKEMNKSDIEKIVNDEIKSFLKKELDNEISNYISKTNSKSRKATNEIVKRGLAKLAEFLYIRRTVWQNDIK